MENYQPKPHPMKHRLNENRQTPSLVDGKVKTSTGPSAMNSPLKYVHIVNVESSK